MSSNRSNKVLLLLVLISILLLAGMGLRIGDIPTDFLDVYHAVFNYSEQNLSELIIREIRLPRITIAIISTNDTFTTVLPSTKSSCQPSTYIIHPPS